MQRRVVAVTAGVIGAALGLAGALTGAALLAVLAGAAALAAGLLAATPERRGTSDATGSVPAGSAPTEVPEPASATAADPVHTAPPAADGPSPVDLSDPTAADLRATAPASTDGHDAHEVPAHAPTPADGSPSGPVRGDDVAALTDPVSGLFSEAYFRVALGSRLASARRHLRPVAVALLDVSEGLAAEGAHHAPPKRVAESIAETVREADIACRLTDGAFAVILEDTPENGAVWTVERIRRNLVSRFGSHTMWAGVACYPAHAFGTDELIDQARAALVAAREWKQDRIEVAIAD